MAIFSKEIIRTERKEIEKQVGVFPYYNPNVKCLVCAQLLDSDRRFTALKLMAPLFSPWYYFCSECYDIDPDSAHRAVLRKRLKQEINAL